MAIDGYVVKLDLPELREMVSLLRYSSNNLNQLTRRVHETGRVYAADMDDILQNQERIWQAASGILSRLPPSDNGVFIPCGGGLLRAGRPCFLFPVILAIWSIFLYPVLTIQNEWRKKRCAFF